MQNVDTLYQSKFPKSRVEKKDNLMAGSNHNQLHSSWDLHPGKGGRWAIYPYVPKWDISQGGRWEEQGKKYSSINKASKPGWRRGNLKYLIIKTTHTEGLSHKQNSFSRETLKWARRKHSFAPTRAHPLSTSILFTESVMIYGPWAPMLATGGERRVRGRGA